MCDENDDTKLVHPHHVQQALCTTRLPYRQGRKLTAVKTYTINTESTHLLIFNVPSINLRQEAKSLFLRFGKLLKFNISPEHKSELFTETYHAVYEKIQSSRLAKKFLDTKTFYGSSLHVCYAPEFESLDEVRYKLLQRKSDVLHRISYLKREAKFVINEDNRIELTDTNLQDTNNKVEKLNMGDINTISVGKQIRDVFYKSNKRKRTAEIINKRKPVPIMNEVAEPTFIGPIIPEGTYYKPFVEYNKTSGQHNDSLQSASTSRHNLRNDEDLIHVKACELIDATSAEIEVISNMNDGLNYNNFGNEVIRKIPEKPLSKIQFSINKKLH